MTFRYTLTYHDHCVHNDYYQLITVNFNDTIIVTPDNHLQHKLHNIISHNNMIIVIVQLPYSGKVWRGECLANLLFISVWWKKVWRMNRSAKGLLIITANLDGFSLVNHRQFAKFAKLSTRQIFSLYSNCLAM